MKRATGMTNLVTCMVDHCNGAQAVSVTFATGFKFSYSGDCRPCSQLVEIGRDSTVLLHEATFDDEMQSDAEAKKHSTMSEAIGVALAMNAKRLLLTHFSQRYQKIPQLGALDKIRIRFDDPEVVNNDMEGVDIPNDPEIMGDPVDNELELEQQRLGQQQLTVTPTPASASPKYRQPITFSPDAGSDLKVGIAFDFMRVRVGDITHLEKFTPVIQHLFEVLESEDKGKAQDSPNEVKRRTKGEEKQRKQDIHAQQIEQNRLKKEANKRKQQEQTGAGRKKRGQGASRDGMTEHGWCEGIRDEKAVADISITSPNDAIGEKNEAIADLK